MYIESYFILFFNIMEIYIIPYYIRVLIDLAKYPCPIIILNGIFVEINT